MKTKELIDTRIENLSEVRGIFLTREVFDKIDGPRQKSNGVRMYEKSGNLLVFDSHLCALYAKTSGMFNQI